MMKDKEAKKSKLIILISLITLCTALLFFALFMKNYSGSGYAVESSSESSSQCGILSWFGIEGTCASGSVRRSGSSAASPAAELLSGANSPATGTSPTATGYDRSLSDSSSSSTSASGSVSAASLLTETCVKGACLKSEFCCRQPVQTQTTGLGRGEIDSKPKVTYPGGGICCAGEVNCGFNPGAGKNVPPTDYCDYSTKKAGCDKNTKIPCFPNCCDKATQWCSFQDISLGGFLLGPLSALAHQKAGICLPLPEKTCPSDKPNKCGWSGSKTGDCCVNPSDCKISPIGVSYCSRSECPPGYEIARGTGATYGPGAKFEINLCCDTKTTVAGNYPNGRPRCVPLPKPCKIKITSLIVNPPELVGMVNPTYELQGRFTTEGDCSGDFEIDLYSGGVCPYTYTFNGNSGEFTLGPFSTSGDIGGSVGCPAAIVTDKVNSVYSDWATTNTPVCIQPCNEISLCHSWNDDLGREGTAAERFGRIVCGICKMGSDGPYSVGTVYSSGQT